MCLEKGVYGREVIFGMGECGLQVPAVEFLEGDTGVGGQGQEQTQGADGVPGGVDQQHGQGDILGIEARRKQLRCGGDAY